MIQQTYLIHNRDRPADLQVCRSRTGRWTRMRRVHHRRGGYGGEHPHGGGWKRFRRGGIERRVQGRMKRRVQRGNHGRLVRSLRLDVEGVEVGIGRAECLHRG